MFVAGGCWAGMGHGCRVAVFGGFFGRGGG